MTIDEAIEQFKYDAECNRADLDLSYAEHNEQIAEWLEELKYYRDKSKMVVRVDAENMDSIKDKFEKLSKYAETQYNKAIDDLRNELKNHYIEYTIDSVLEDTNFYSYTTACNYFEDYIDEIAERLKAGGKNDNL